MASQWNRVGDRGAGGGLKRGADMEGFFWCGSGVVGTTSIKAISIIRILQNRFSE